MNNPITIRDVFIAKQRHLLAALEIVPSFTDHGTTIGDDTEANWVRVLQEFLPARYGVAKGIVMDSCGARSEQIDVIIYDPQYSPLLARAASGDLFIPAEAVYAVFEVKQEMNRPFMDYAGSKIASVRRLHRTSVAIQHAGGVYDPKEPIPILGGLLTTRNGWADPQGQAPIASILALEGERRVDLGCALQGGSFRRTGDPTQPLQHSDAETTLIYFLLSAFERLQAVGTVAAVDMAAYLTPLADPSRDLGV